MPCFSPLSGCYSSIVNPSGKRSVVFEVSKADISKGIVQVPCGRCIGCRLERSRQWAVRCVHEAQLHKDNCFITLTYSPENVPKDSSLHLEHFQKFMKRLRKYIFTEVQKVNFLISMMSVDTGRVIGYVPSQGVRFFHCGEYGELLSRPHYHACLFGFDFSDKVLWSTRGGVRLYRSKVLEKLWTFGFSTIGDVTFESAAYVARYCTKKITGDEADKHYNGRSPEYVTMSRRPCIVTGKQIGRAHV